MDKKYLINKIMKFYNCGCLGDDLLSDFILGRLPIQEVESIKNEMEQLYVKDRFYRLYDNIESVQILGNNRYEVHYVDGPTKIYEVGIDKEILMQQNWEDMDDCLYRREI